MVVIQSSGGNYRTTEWKAPRLKCEDLLVKAEQKQPDGSFRLSAETKAAWLKIGEPDPTLFSIGPELVEMKPSDAMLRFWSSLDLAMNDEDKADVIREIEREGAEADKS